MTPLSSFFRTHMSALVVFAVALMVISSSALACSPVPDERSFSQKFFDAPVSFIGTVSSADGNHVVFNVEQALKGVNGPIYELDTQMSTCHIAFESGQRWLYAGNLSVDPSVLLGSPSTGYSGNLKRIDDTALHLPKEFQSCTSNKDCVALDYGCSRTAVTKSHYEEAQSLAFERVGDPKAASCPSGTMNNSVPFPICQAGVCGIWGF